MSISASSFLDSAPPAMVEASSGPAKPALGRGFWACLAAALLALLSLSPYLTSSTELVRIRNALSMADELPPDFAVLAPGPQSLGHSVGAAVPSPFFVQVAKELGLASMSDDWQRSLAISKHLLSSSPVLLGGAIQADLQTTYLRITRRGEGYCGDFARVFHAIAQAAGMTSRSWAFSFDGFGGHGHVWPEIWNRQQQRWQLVGIFNNYYFTTGDGRPLSALAFRQALLAGQPGLAMNVLYAGARLGFPIEAKGWDYYRRGLDQWYFLWDEDVFASDRDELGRILGAVSYSLSRLAELVQGDQPQVRILPTPGNRAMAQQLRRLRWHLLAVVLVVSAALGGALLLALRRHARLSHA